MTLYTAHEFCIIEIYEIKLDGEILKSLNKSNFSTENLINQMDIAHELIMTELEADNALKSRKDVFNKLSRSHDVQNVKNSLDSLQRVNKSTSIVKVITISKNQVIIEKEGFLNF